VIREAIAVLCDFAGGTIPDPRHCLDALPGQGSIAIRGTRVVMKWRRSMDKTVAGIVAMASVFAVPAHAATPPLTPDTVMQVNSYADLLKPIPNATALLKAQAQADPAAEGNVMEVQYWRHHHHHHHHWRRRRWHHHHHHHNT
jgi:hypothetical protein